MKVEQPGAYAFTQLKDVPNTYLGSASEYLAVNLTETGIDFVPGGGGGGSPGGVSGAVQYNNAGAFGGGELLWNESTNNLDTTNGTVIAVNYRVNSGIYQSTLSSFTLTSNQNIVFPDASGTVGLLNSFSVDSSATSGPATYDNTTGVFSIPNYGSATVVETEVDFGTKPTTDATFTITDASITPASKIVVVESGNPATGRADGDSLWDSISYAAKAATGQFTLYAKASGAVAGPRKLYYSYS